MNILITGSNGFVGGHLATTLSLKGHTVYGVGRDDTSTSHAVSSYIKANLADYFPFIDNPIDTVIHLAGLAAVGPSFEKPQQYIDINSSMVTHMCEHYLRQERKPRIIIVSSGAVYENNQPMPITETSVVGYNSPYAVSKTLTENQASYYKKRGLDCIVVRPFNHIGPGQGSGFIVPDLYEKIASAPKDGIIKVGNISTRRDYTDVRDIANAYVALAEAQELSQTVYNACSGTSHSGKEIFDQLKVIMERNDVTVSIDPSLIRPNETMEIIGNSQRLQNEIDWRPTFNFEQTLRDFVASAESTQ